MSTSNGFLLLRVCLQRSSYAPLRVEAKSVSSNVRLCLLHAAVSGSFTTGLPTLYIEWFHSALDAASFGPLWPKFFQSAELVPWIMPIFTYFCESSRSCFKLINRAARFPSQISCLFLESRFRMPPRCARAQLRWWTRSQVSECCIVGLCATTRTLWTVDFMNSTPNTRLSFFSWSSLFGKGFGVSSTSDQTHLRVWSM